MGRITNTKLTEGNVRGTVICTMQGPAGNGQEITVVCSPAMRDGNVIVVEGQNVPLMVDRKRDGSPYLIDAFPMIHGDMSRHSIIDSLRGQGQHVDPEVTLKTMQDKGWGAWRCWDFIQKWKRLMHGSRRLKHKRALWHWLGELLQMYKRRTDPRGRPMHYLDWDFPPGTLPDDGSRERCYPNAKMGLDRQAPKATSSSDPHGSAYSSLSRHRIMQ